MIVAAEPTVFAIDDDQPFLLSLAALAESMGVGCRAFPSGKHYFHEFDPAHPGCLVLESRISDLPGLEIQERLAREPIAPPVIFVTAYADLKTAPRAMRLGAINFLQKQSFSETELWESIQQAIARDAENRRRHARQVMLRGRLSQLSDPERQVLILLMCGKSNREIGDTLGVNRRAVESRRARLMRKLEVSTLPELVRFALEVGLFNLPELSAGE
jgi:two-component system response regulator FixJ